MKKYSTTVVLLLTLVVLLGVWEVDARVTASGQAAAPSRQGAWLDSLVFYEQTDPYQAVAQLQANELDVYAYTVTDPALYQTVLENPDLTSSESYGSYYEITFNPHGPTFYDGRLNPFSNARIREAMNWLIDRNKIAQEFFGGLAVPKVLPLLHIDVDYSRFQTTIDTLEAQYAYNFSLAQSTITTEMLGMGATLENGVWMYNNEPVTVIFLIRVEDQRLNIGDYVSDQLEEIGFVIDRQYKTRSEASPIWNMSDPGEGQWHIYTGGWINTSISRDDASNFGYFYTPLGSSSPLWQAYNPTPEFQDVSNRLWTSDFATIGERATLFEQALSMAMNDNGPNSEGAGSVRVWLVDSQSFAPRRAEMVVASDLVSSITGGDMFPFVARYEGVEGGEMRIAQPGLLVDPWNPIAGSGWVYDSFPIRATADNATLTDPNTGLDQAQRIESADCVVKEGFTITKTLDWVSLSFTPTITVPSDAWADWDAYSQTFIAAGDMPNPILQANTRCTITYPADLFTTVTWHDGSPLSPGDFIMRMILQFDRAKPESAIYDSTAVPELDSFMSHFRGVKIESINPLVITTYDDQWWLLDIESIIQNETWWPAYGYTNLNPGAWHNLAPAIRAEAAGQLAFSADKANMLGVPWTNFVDGESLPIMEYWMNLFAGEDYIPYLATMGDYVPQGEADARWAALQAWYTAHHHFWLGTGPFYVQQVSFNPKLLTLAHFDAYPDASGKWDNFAASAQPELAINHTSGAPGSYFNVTGTGFPQGSQAFVVVNDHILGLLEVDSSGVISFTLSTEGAASGVYHLRVSVNPSAGVQFTLDNAGPVQPREGELPIITLPPARSILLPFVNRN